MNKFVRTNSHRASIFFKISLGFLGAMQIMQYISRTSYGKVSVCLAGWLSITAGIVSKRLLLHL